MNMLSACALPWSRIAPEWSAEDIARWVVEAHERDPNIIGLGFGEKTIDDMPTGQLAAVVLVRRKREPGDPELLWEIPIELRGMVTDVIQRVPLMIDHTEPVDNEERKHCGGGRVDIDLRPCGTLGCTVVWHDEDGTTHRSVLSNAHVIVPARPLVGEDDEGPVPARDADDAVTVYDNHRFSRQREAIATLSRYVPLVPKGRGYNLLDGACARITSSKVRDGIAGVGAVREAYSPDELRLGVRVFKTGAASGVRAAGRVRLMRAAYILRTGDYGLAGRGSTFVFAEQVVSEVHQIGGDSGSVMVDEEGRAVGLVHARHPEGWAVAAPAWTVERQLGVRFGDPAP
jgi:hypothetical protein